MYSRIVCIVSAHEVTPQLIVAITRSNGRTLPHLHRTAVFNLFCVSRDNFIWLCNESRLM